MGVLDGKVAVVTGAGRGLGRAHAIALAAAGASVLVNDVDGDAAAAVVVEITGAGGAAAADLTDLGTMAGARAVIDTAVAAFGTVDVLVNNAGISQRQLLDELDEVVLDRHLAVHLKATIATTQAAFPVMRAAGGGRIVNTVSGAGLRPEHPGTTSYTCAKAAVYAATLVAAAEGAPHGIMVNAVSPLAVTPMSAAFFERTDPSRGRPHRRPRVGGGGVPRLRAGGRSHRARCCASRVATCARPPWCGRMARWPTTGRRRTSLLVSTRCCSPDEAGERSGPLRPGHGGHRRSQRG